MEPVHWGVLGAARIARRRVLPVLDQAPTARLVAVASRDPAGARAFATEFGAERAYTDYHDLLADPDIEAVYVPLPNHLHMEWSIAALEAGKHVLCEKPLALNAEQARRMADAAQAADRMLLEAFMYRMGPTTVRLIEIIRSGALGELRAMHASFNYPMEPDPANVRPVPRNGGRRPIRRGQLLHQYPSYGDQPRAAHGLGPTAPLGGPRHRRRRDGRAGFRRRPEGHLRCQL